jgi:16S rRNA processing protein RimM
MNFLKIGKIVDTHKMDGEIKVLPITDNPELFFEQDFLMLSEKGKISRSIDVSAVRTQNEYLLIKSDSINSLEEAKLIKGFDIVIPENILPQPAENEVYFKDIQNSPVFDEEGNHIGVLVDYIESGSADVFRIKKENEDSYYLISNNPVHVLEIDVENKKIIVLSEGLVSEDI